VAQVVESKLTQINDGTYPRAAKWRGVAALAALETM
jgi:hypothetical protein